MVSGGGDNEFDVPLNLVPLIDILTNILFFLLVSFASQELQYEAGGIKLPSAASNADMKPSVTLALSGHDLLVEQVAVAQVKDGKIVAAKEGDKIVPLYEKLNTLRSARSAKTAGMSESDDVVFLLCDREIPFSILSPVMKTAAMAGYPNFRFAVVKK